MSENESSTQTITDAKASAVLAEATNRLDAEREDGLKNDRLADQIAQLEAAVFEAAVAGHPDAVEVYGDMLDLVRDFPGDEYLSPDGTLA